jgi:hypothetical protein
VPQSADSKSRRRVEKIGDGFFRLLLNERLALIGVFLNDVRSTPTNGHRAARTPRPKSADFVAKVS